MNIKVSSNASEVVEGLRSSLDEYQKNLEYTLFRALSLLEAEIVQNIRVNSGLHVRTGALLNSVPASKNVYDVGGGTLVGEIGPQGIPYAAIQEFGGRTSPHVIRPRVAEALHFVMNGKDVFARSVNHPGSNIPARPYLRPALAATQDKIVQEFGLFLRASFPQAKE